MATLWVTQSMVEHPSEMVGEINFPLPPRLMSFPTTVKGEIWEVHSWSNPVGRLCFYGDDDEDDDGCDTAVLLGERRSLKHGNCPVRILQGKNHYFA